MQPLPSKVGFSHTICIFKSAGPANPGNPRTVVQVGAGLAKKIKASHMCYE